MDCRGEMMKKLTLMIDRCTGCKRCEMACIAEHSETKSYISTSLSGFEPKTRIFVDSVINKPVPVICRHCSEPLCVSACMAGCMQKDPLTGIVTNMGHEQKCVGCWMCIMACPFGVINPSFDIGSNEKFAQALKCDLCPERDIPACVEGCPNEVIAVKDL